MELGAIYLLAFFIGIVLVSVVNLVLNIIQLKKLSTLKNYMAHIYTLVKGGK